MKKLLAILLTLMIIICGLPITASADIEPPKTLGAPEHFGASHYYVDQLYFTFSTPEDLRSYIEKRAADDPNNKQTFAINFQVDYKINSGSWHYTSAWDSPKTAPAGLKNLSASFRNEKTYSFSERWSMSGIFQGNEDLKPFYEGGWDYLKGNSITLRARFIQSFDGGITFVISPWSKEFTISADVKADYNKLINHAPTLVSVDLKSKGGVPYFYIKTGKVSGEVLDLHAMSGSVRTEIWMRRAGDKDFKYIHYEWSGYEYSEIDVRNYFEDNKQSYEEESFEIKIRFALDLRKYKQAGVNSTTAADIYGPFSNVISHNMPAWSQASQWATEELKKADDAGLIPQSLKGEDMTKPITREEFAELAVKLYENAMGVQSTPASPNPFTDTANPEILKAFKLGVTNGISATEFAPKELTNREQVATMLSRTIRAIAPGADYGTAGAPSFSDQNEISSWALDHVLFMARLGIIKGTDGKFMPKATTSSQKASGYATTTREMAIAMSVRSFEQMDTIKESRSSSETIPQPTSEPEKPTQPETKGNPIVGVWETGSMNGFTYNMTTAKFKYNSGIGQRYYFNNDGTFSSLIASSYGVAISITGKYTVAGNTITFTDQKGVISNDAGENWAPGNSPPDQTNYFAFYAEEYLLIGLDGAELPLDIETNAVSYWRSE